MKTKTKKTPPIKATKALVPRKQPAPPLITIEDPKGLMAGNLMPVGQLGELATVGALGLAELKLTDAEEAILSEPVNPAEILVRDGGIAYLPHIAYTRWFGRAFGRTGWAIVPTAKPQKVGNLILIPYLLYVHGVPVCAATGEHEYHENNSRQTYGDVIESTVACALRRCAKRLGVGLEMWDKRWLEANIRVGKKAARSEDFIDARAEPVASSQLESKAKPAVLTAAQWKRLESIAVKSGRDNADVRLWLQKRYSKDLKQVQQADYAEICRVLESRGALPLPGDGQ